jgi:hypothetical protein
MMLAVIERKRKVSFGEAWHVLQTNGVRTYAVCARVLVKETKEG